MKNVILSIALTALIGSGTLNWAFLTGRFRAEPQVAQVQQIQGTTRDEFTAFLDAQAGR